MLSRYRQTVCRISMESSTTRTLRGIETPGSAQQAISLPARGQAGGEDHCPWSKTLWNRSGGLGVGVVGDLFFDVHVLELAGLEDFSALQTLDVLSFFIARDDLHARVLARFIHWFLRGRARG